ncbi:MAG: hypothetical protein QOF52_3383, partial [Propionibacteriaceae bacterium]|nr:hypothetical protein [Propionibacteriaceae bacterium]
MADAVRVGVRLVAAAPSDSL